MNGAKSINYQLNSINQLAVRFRQLLLIYDDCKEVRKLNITNRAVSKWETGV